MSLHCGSQEMGSGWLSIFINQSWYGCNFVVETRKDDNLWIWSDQENPNVFDYDVLPRWIVMT